MGASFSAEVKRELCKTEVGRRCCARAEAYGILLFCNTFHSREARIITESPHLKARLPILFRRAFHFSFDTILDKEGGKSTFLITDKGKLRAILELFGHEVSSAPSLHINFAVLEDEQERTAFFRGAFLSGGAVTDPLKGYHLEFATSHYYVGREMPVLLREAGLEAKETTRKGNYIVYFKQSEHIEDFLTAVGAPVSAMAVMTAKLERDLRGSGNRRVNCDSANLDKTVAAAQNQIDAIERLRQRGVLQTLPEGLAETARLRTAHPELTLSQLCELFDPPLTKSALNHRLRRLVELAASEGEGA